jgi:hypothetical protein
MNLSATQDSNTDTARVSEPANSTARARGERSGSRRQIGPLGTLARIAGGVVAIALPIALDGLTVFEAAIALIALPLIAAIAAPLITSIFRRLAPNALQSRQAICSAPGCSLIAVMVVANSALVDLTSANGNVTIWVWLGASMLVAAARGYGGCEVLAVSNLITGRREEIGCILYTPIDLLEASRRARTEQPS